MFCVLTGPALLGFGISTMTDRTQLVVWLEPYQSRWLAEYVFISNVCLVRFVALKSEIKLNHMD